MILLDSDVLVLDLRYKQAPRFPVNNQVLQLVQKDALDVGITEQALLGVVGILSFSTPPAQIPQLAEQVQVRYGLLVLPDPPLYPEYAACSVQEVVAQIGRQMALADAVQAVQIARYAAFADCLLTWNARHFVGKVVIPVLTPADWLSQQPGGTP